METNIPYESYSKLKARNFLGVLFYFRSVPRKFKYMGKKWTFLIKYFG